MLLAGASDAARRLTLLLGTRRLQPQLFIMLLVAGLAGLASALIVPLTWGDRPRVPATPEFVLLWLIGGRVRHRRRVAGQVPPPGGADDARRRRPGRCA